MFKQKLSYKGLYGNCVELFKSPVVTLGMFCKAS